MTIKPSTNRLILFISAGLIAIALVILCVSSAYERSLNKDTPETKPDTTVSTTVKKDENKGGTTTPVVSTPVTNTPVTTEPVKTVNGAGKYKVVTKNDPLGIRIQAAKDSERVSEIPKGSEIDVLTVFDSWGYVNQDGVGGWIAMEYVELISASNTPAKHEPGKYIIGTKDDPLGIRTKPEQEAERAGEVPKGETVEILAFYGDWGYVNYNGVNGWLSSKYLKEA